MPSKDPLRQARLRLVRGKRLSPDLEVQGLSPRRMLVYEAARNQLLTRLDDLLDEHIEAAPGQGDLEAMLRAAGAAFLERGELERVVPIRGVEALEIRYHDHLWRPRKLLLGKPSRPVEVLESYQEAFALSLSDGAPLGGLTCYGELTAFDEGYLQALGQILDTAILAFHRRRQAAELRRMLRRLDDLMAADVPIERKRAQLIAQVQARTRAREGFMVVLRDGRRPTAATVTPGDLRVAEATDEAQLDEEKIAYILAKSVAVLRASGNVAHFDDQRSSLGWALATELEVDVTGKLGGAFLLFDDQPFRLPRRELAEEASLKADDYLVFNMELREETARRKRVLDVLVPMVGDDQARYLLEEHELRRFSCSSKR